MPGGEEVTVIVRTVGSVVIVGLLVVSASETSAAQQLTCAQIVAMHRFAGGKMSAEDLAKNLHVDVAMVRDCLDKSAKDTLVTSPNGTTPTTAPPRAAAPATTTPVTAPPSTAPKAVGPTPTTPTAVPPTPTPPAK